MPANRPHLVLTTLTTLSLVFALAACSTTGSASSSASAGVAGATASDSAATATGAGASAGAAGDACAVLPVQDVQTALGVSGLKTTSATLGEASACSYQTSDGATVASTTVTKDGGASFDAFKSSQGAVQIPGVADGAYVFESQLYIKKGDTSFLFTLASPEDVTPQKLQEIAGVIAKAVAGHM
jgi:hypothetical protein